MGVEELIMVSWRRKWLFRLLVCAGAALGIFVFVAIWESTAPTGYGEFAEKNAGKIEKADGKMAEVRFERPEMGPAPSASSATAAPTTARW